MTQIGSHDVHPAAELFPLLDGPAFDALVEDINLHGLRNPVMLTSVTDPADPDDVIDLVLDGRNRYLACIKNGVRPHFEYYRGHDPVDYVISTNLHRRHLDESQRAMVAAKVAKLGHGGDRVSEQAAKVRLATPTQAKAAELLNVSERSVQNATKVQADGAPELAQAVEQGRVAVSTAATIATLPEAEQRDVVRMSDADILRRAKDIRNARTEERRGERIKRIEVIAKGNQPLDGTIGQFPIIYADPPWRYHALVSDARVIENQYPTMSIEDICALAVQQVTTKDALLVLWVPEPLLMREGKAVIDAWGFEHRSGMVWDKEDMGMGHWTRVQHEHLLICVKGDFPTPPRDACIRSVIRCKKGEHSSKPHTIYEWLEKAYPTLPKLELFCRTPRQGWTVWGNQSAEELVL